MQERHPARAPRQRGVVLSYSVLGVLAGLAVAGIAILILWQTNVIFKSSSKGGTSGAIPAIHFRYPRLWTQLPKSRWAAIGAPSNASAVLERTGNSANLVVLRAGAAVVNTDTVQKLNGQLKAKYSDYKFISARKITLPNVASAALFFVYGRQNQGVLHTITVIPAPPVSFVVETASPPKNKTIERQIGVIIQSASLTYPKK